jgi:hypothetical protein
MVAACAYRLPFLIAAALIAAAFGDWFVESISNTGIFGAAYHDDNHLSVVPTMLAGLIVALEIAAFRFLQVWRSAPGRSRSWIAAAASDLTTHKRVEDFACVFALQIAAVFVMENAEQVLAGGRLLGGTVWLGAPIAASLALHALIGWSCVLLLRRLMRVLIDAFVSLAHIALGFIFIARECESSGPFVRRRRDPGRRSAVSAPARHIGGRAPPLRPATASSFNS